jgi:aerobic-type carbon monoxide dehydrogenase small subunit (CoxS/CutS family)
MISLIVNGERRDLDTDPATPLLWVLRDTLALTGTKYGCGIALCGACTVHVDGVPVRACVTPLSAVAGKTVTTIEGLSKDNSHPVQRAWIALDVPQCGYCQSGQIMTAAALLASKPNPSDVDIDQAMSGVLCRCGTYSRIRRAIKLAAAQGSANVPYQDVPMPRAQDAQERPAGDRMSRAAAAAATPKGGGES